MLCSGCAMRPMLACATLIAFVFHQVLARESHIAFLALQGIGQAVCVDLQRSQLINGKGCLQRPVQRRAFERFLPAGPGLAQVSATAGQLAGRVELHALLRGAHDPDQRSFAVSSPAGDAAPLGNMALPDRLFCFDHSASSAEDSLPA